MNKYLNFPLFLLFLVTISINAQNNKDIDILKYERTKLNAELGNADAQYSLATYYKYGKLIEKNDSLYAKWLHKSADQEYHLAYHSLALYYEFDKKDTDKAIFYYKKDADAKYFDYVRMYGEKKAKDKMIDISSIKSLKEMGIKYQPWKLYNYDEVKSHWIIKDKPVKLTANFENDGFRWIQIDSLGLKGALSINKDILVPCNHHSIKYINDCFLVNDDTTHGGLYDKNGKSIISPYQTINYAHITGIICYIYGNHKFGVVQNTGKILIPQIYKFVQVYGYGTKDKDGLFNNYYFECQTFDNRVEIYDKDFKLIISKERNYNNVTLYKCKNNGVFYYGCTTINPKDNYKSAVCDLEGNELIKTKYTFTLIYDTQNNEYIYQIENGRGLGIINQKGEFITNLEGQKENKTLLSGNKYYLISDINDIWRVEDTNGNIIVSNMLNGGYIIRRDNISYFRTQLNDNIVIFKEDGNCIINENFNYYDIQQKYGYFIGSNSKGKKSIHNLDGKQLYKSDYDYLEPFKRDYPYIIFSENNKYGILNFVENQIIIPPLFDKIESLSQNYLLLKQGGHYGLCDFGGNIILDVDFNEIRISNNYLRVNKNGFHGVYKLDGTPFIIPEKYTNIRMTDTGFEAEVRPKGALTPLESIFISFEGTKLDIAERERLLEEYEQEGDKAFEKEKYKKAGEYYTLAIEINPNDEYLYYNRGVSYYNRTKYTNAIADFERCINIPTCNDDLKDKAIDLINKSKKYQAEKIQRRNELVGDLLGLALATTSVVLDNKINSNNASYYNQNNLSTPNKTESAQVQQWNQQLQQLMISTAIQVNNQEMQEYYNFCAYNKKADGSYYTLSEWRAIQGQAILNLKEQGYDIIAENRKIIEEQKEDFAKQREEDKKAWFAKYGYETSSDNRQNTEITKKETDNVVKDQKDSKDEKLNSKLEEENLDSREQYKSKDVSSDDYHFEKRIDLYMREANRNKVMFSNKDLCKKGANYYVKIDDTYYLVRVQGGWGFNSSIIYAHEKLYFNK